MTSRAVRPFVVLSVVLGLAGPPPVTVAAQEVAAARPPLSARIEIDPLLQPAVSALLHTSPTFVRQCARIAAARHVRLIVLATPAPREQLAPRARSVITRHVHGAIRAAVEIPINGEIAELLGHEFEHVLEQIEGLHLPSLVRDGSDEVFEVQTGVFETARARAAGRAVAAEAEGDTDAFIIAAASRVTIVIRALRARAVRAPGPTLLLRR